MTIRDVSSGETVELIPTVEPADNCVFFFSDGQGLGDSAWFIDFFEGKSNRITFSKFASGYGEIPEITNITLRPAPTMTFLNPRPAPGIDNYPWSYNSDPHSHVIKLPLPLTYAELMEGAQIVVSGVTDAIAVIQGTVEGNLLVFRAGGLLIANVTNYEGSSDLVNLAMREDFTGEILAVSFDKAYKNVSYENGMDIDSNSILSYLTAGGSPVAKCILNGVVISDDTNFIPSNGLLGNLVFQSQYIQDYGNVIESYYWTNGRYLYVLRVGEEYKMEAIRIDNTNSPLSFPMF